MIKEEDSERLVSDSLLLALENDEKEEEQFIYKKHK